MNSFSHNRLIKRMVALLGATGLAAFSGLPALAQVSNSINNDGVLNPNPSILNESPYNRGLSSEGTQPLQRSVDCSAYVSGGVGGPINNSSQSSYNTATVPQNRSSDSLNQSNTNYPPGVLGNSAVSANQGNSSQSSYDTATIPQNRSDAMNQSDTLSSRDNSNGMSRDGQFSARNPNAAIAFRSNGPAGTAGGESNLNLQAFSADNGANFMQSAMSGTNNRAYSAPDRSSSYQSANPIPVECLPGGSNNR